jgi:hypothetical protein
MRWRKRSVHLGLAVAVAGALASGCGGGGACTVDETYHPTIDPADFVAAIDNPLLPWAVGTHFTYVGGEETIEVTVTSDTRTILGVPCVVVRDTVTVDGELVEDTYDWYAQDADGNVWYLGEETAEYEGGEVVSTEGSWEAGVDGAQPGIVMPADPTPGPAYRQEYYPCHAEDMAEVVSTSESVTVPYGSFDGCLQTREFTPLEPDVNEYKYYCDGVGLVLEVDVASGARVELTAVTP